MKKILINCSLVLMILAVVTICFSGCSKKVTYTVTFDSMGGTQIDSQLLKEGESATKPKDPQKEGFTFVEWQLDGVGYDFNNIVSKDIILTACYDINENTEIVLVMLDYQNGQEMTIVEIIKGGKMTEPPKPLKQGYKFVGWFNNDSKYKFDSEVNENVTLTAKWEKDKTAISQNNKNDSSNKSNNSNSQSDNSNIADNQQQGNQSTSTNYDKIVEKYSGRWYLSGYADVCIDVSKHDYVDDSVMSIIAHNFSLPMDGTSDFPIVPGYTIYPGKYTNKDTGAVWAGSLEIVYKKWNECLNKEKVILGNNCIYINNNKFVKEKGTKDRYFDTCYREAIGTWYLHNQPNSIIKITADCADDFTNSDDFILETKLFDLKTFATNVSTSYAGGGCADRKSDWDKYGISVSNGVLTITNSNGTRTFYKTKTYQKVSGISLNTTNVLLTLSDSFVLKATISPSDAYDKTVTWSTSDSSVAEVSSAGYVIPRGEGTTVITVKSKDGNHTATCNVTVFIPHVTDVSLNKNSVELYKGDSETLTATITPSNAIDKTITWSSSDNSIVTVSSSGKITAQKPGTATITVTTKDGGYVAKCTVVVKQKPLKVSASIGMAIKTTSNSIQKGVSVTIKASGGSENYVAYSIKLYRNGTYIGEVSDKELFATPFLNGTYTAEVYVKDSSGNEATATETTTISVS